MSNNKTRYKRHSVLAEDINDYLKFRRNGGVKYETAEYDFDQLDKYLIKNNVDSKILTREILVPYISLKDGEKVTNQVGRASLIRQFTRYLLEVKKYEGTFTSIDSASRRGENDYIPYIFKEEEIAKIINEAHNYSSHTPNVLPNIRNIVSCAIEMLYCTGMRNGEIVNLKVEDVDVKQGLIYVREAKNNNKRIVTMSDSLKKEVERYCDESNKYNLSGVYFFDVGLPRNDGKLYDSCVYRYFREILKKVGIEHKGKGHGPRLHDLRHTFICHSLKQLSNLDGDINAYLVYLSTFVGHKSLLETQKYIWLTEELFKDTNEKLEAYTSFISDIYEESLNETSV